MKGKIFAFVFGAVAISTLLFASGASAASFGTSDNPKVDKDEVIDSSFYAAGENVTILGTVKGDVYCAGQNISIDGVVEGDVLCAGQTLSIDGEVKGNVRVAGQLVSVGATVGQSVTAFGQSVTLTDSSSVAYDATVFAASARLSGQIGRDVVGGASSVSVSGGVGRDAELGAEALTLDAKSSIAGNLIYTSKNKATIDPTAFVGGITTQNIPEEIKPSVEKHASAYGNMVAGSIFGFLVILAIGALMFWLAPDLFKKAASNLQAQPLQTFGWGFVAIVCIPVLMILLIITIIGIPLTFMLCAACFIWAMVAHAIASYALGGWMVNKFKWNSGELMAFVIGLLVLSVASIIPVLGMIVSFVAWICGFGAIITTAWKWRFGKKAKAVRT
ncbi:MAG: polymer-forming cytoskeletal protein [Candidatus Woesebacteria bacterium]|jgi:cytoskeletal protein CcmA (bactofilin family)